MGDVFDENEGGIFNDDGTRINPTLIPTPSLCITCTQNDSADAEENILCALTRADQNGEPGFLCFAYMPNSPNIKREAVLRKICVQIGVDYEEPPQSQSEEDIRF